MSREKRVTDMEKRGVITGEQASKLLEGELRVRDLSWNMMPHKSESADVKAHETALDAANARAEELDAAQGRFIADAKMQKERVDAYEKRAEAAEGEVEELKEENDALNEDLHEAEAKLARLKELVHASRMGGILTAKDFLAIIDGDGSDK